MKKILIFLAILSLFACDDSISKLSLDNTAPNPVSNLQILETGGEYVKLIWSVPNSKDAAFYKIYKKENTETQPITNFIYTDQLLVNLQNAQQGIIIDSLAFSTNYDFAVSVCDESLNESELHKLTGIETLNNNPVDTTPPSDITELQLVPSFSEGYEIIEAVITASFVAPGDDGDNGITEVEVRYSPFGPVNSNNWQTAFPYQGQVFSGVAGETTIIELPLKKCMAPPPVPPDYAFYFAARAIDEAGNTSAIKNFSGKITAEVIRKSCISCWECLDICPENAISKQNGKAFIDLSKCVRCGDCILTCEEKGNEAIKYYITE